ncbi:unnamed protein product [Cuscuta epithymum]|uniref:RRM domain-containing protein n=1 Tax=Cuscuta epithymum TaxID=186058 RepID=A0AAV0EGZ7_9ASTE|nr:unnamed protein product [Cuscuta epithymum]
MDGEAEEELKSQGAESNATISKATELDNLKMRLRAMEKEAEVLRGMQAEVENQMGDDAPDSTVTTEEVDARSIYVGNVDYECTVEELQLHFQECGTVNRVTILCDKFGQPKGFAYVEFLEEEAVTLALQLNESDLHERKVKVMPKRKNIPGMRQRRPRRFSPYVIHGHPIVPSYIYSPYGYGNPTFRRPR